MPRLPGKLGISQRRVTSEIQRALSLMFQDYLPFAFILLYISAMRVSRGEIIIQNIYFELKCISTCKVGALICYYIYVWGEKLCLNS